MAKKSVATFSGDEKKNRKVVKCIRMLKSKKTGAYVFDEGLVASEEASKFFSKK
ncbi:MAG: DUF4295 domain-containing protein [Bacteroidales bacterium]|jgi:hypothetical protein|nr:DUF4295 domain-containing protein [Bacteroidales bacterium]